MTERTSANAGHGALTATAVNPVVGSATTGLAAGRGTLTAATYAKISVAAALGGHGGLLDYAPVTPTQVTLFPVTGHYNAVTDPSISSDLNTPVIQPISALVTFTPRLEKGQLIYIHNYLVSPAYNAEQTVNILGVPVSGTWTLGFGGVTTPPLPWNATPTQVQSALQALSTIGTGNVHVVADVEPFAYDVQFTGGLGLQPIPVLDANGDLLDNAEGAGFCEVTVAATLLGSNEIIADAAIAIPTLTARIWNGVLSTIDVADTPGFQLVANSDALDLDTLIYDVTFSNVTYNGASQFMAPFAFTAPSYDETICLTDPTLTRLPYQQPSTTTWIPSTDGGPLMLLGPNTWRTRAAAGRRRCA